MSNKIKSLPLDGSVELIDQMASDFLKHSERAEFIPRTQIYKIAHAVESSQVERSARMTALMTISKPKGITKVAFDTRRIDQQRSRNPRKNLQNWNRSEEFIDNDLSGKIKVFAKLMNTMDDIDGEWGDQPEYLDSYSRVLHDHVQRILRIKQGDLEIFRPQIAYLEQLLFARYRISMEELSRIGDNDLKKKILNKDEDLLKRGAFLLTTEDKNKKKDTIVLKDGNATTQESIVNAIFGKDSGLRREGERVVERTITITIRDEVQD